MIISLTGFMGVGKSTISEKLSKKLLCKYIDLDKHIEQTMGMSIQEIFENLGEELFRKIEAKELKNIIEENRQTLIVLSLGGGALISPESRKIVKENTCCIYLRACYDTMCSRLSKTKKERPHIKERDQDVLMSDITRLFKEREDGYKEASKITIDVDGLDIHQIVEVIMQSI